MQAPAASTAAPGLGLCDQPRNRQLARRRDPAPSTPGEEHLHALPAADLRPAADLAAYARVPVDPQQRTAMSAPSRRPGRTSPPTSAGETTQRRPERSRAGRRESSSSSRTMVHLRPNPPATSRTTTDSRCSSRREGPTALALARRSIRPPISLDVRCPICCGWTVLNHP